ncbi:MAG: hypothetical protein PVG39_16550 [Desulfobacteraceae bacterium]|jgi:hypothetical protein
MRRFFILILSGLLITGIAGCKNRAEQAETLKCDRQCLEDFVNKYLDAMVAHDASKAPFAENARYTENADVIPLADISKGIWSKATGLTDYKFYIADPEAGQVAFVGLIRTKDHEDKPVLLSMRLKVENNQITEAEAIVVDSMMGGTGGAMTVPPAAYSEALAPEERISREELVKISNAYFDSIELSNSKIVPWHDECYRLENGMWTAGTKLPPEMAVHMKEPETPQPGPGGVTSIAFARGECTEAIDSGVFALIESIRPRRIPVVDVERGVTWGVYMFNHPGVETITMPDGTTQPAAYFAGQPNSMPMSELFKIKGGKIRDIMAIGVIKEYKSNSGWK